MTKNRKIVYIAAGVVGILIATSVAFALNSDQILRTLGVTKPAPVLSFNVSKAPDWWAAKNYNSQASAANDNTETRPIEELPVASMNVFKGNEGDMATACFVMFSYYGYKVDIAQLKDDKEKESLASAFKRIGESTASLNVLGAQKTITLSNYELTGPDAENSMKGMSYGWVEADDGHMSVNGVCPTGDELNGTVEAVSAISLVRS